VQVLSARGNSEENKKSGGLKDGANSPSGTALFVQGLRKKYNLEKGVCSRKRSGGGRVSTAA